eukprot:scaffold53303_cov31-Tisochrysis_lutea.AAC.1
MPPLTMPAGMPGCAPKAPDDNAEFGMPRMRPTAPESAQGAPLGADASHAPWHAAAAGRPLATSSGVAGVSFSRTVLRSEPLGKHMACITPSAAEVYQHLVPFSRILSPAVETDANEPAADDGTAGAAPNMSAGSEPSAPMPIGGWTKAGATEDVAAPPKSPKSSLAVADPKPPKSSAPTLAADMLICVAPPIGILPMDVGTAVVGAEAQRLPRASVAMAEPEACIPPIPAMPIAEVDACCGSAVEDPKPPKSSSELELPM